MIVSHTTKKMDTFVDIYFFKITLNLCQSYFFLRLIANNNKSYIIIFVVLWIWSDIFCPTIFMRLCSDSFHSTKKSYDKIFCDPQMFLLINWYANFRTLSYYSIHWILKIFNSIFEKFIQIWIVPGYISFKNLFLFYY